MKLEEKREAIRLRQVGLSLKEIKNSLGVSKSTVSKWVRNIELSKIQKEEILKKGMLRSVIEQRRSTRLRNEFNKKQLIIEKAKKDVKKLSAKELWLIGIMLYWAEGSKTQRNLVQFTNSDPEMIKLMMFFFRTICKVPDDKFRGQIHIHPHQDYITAEKYWSSISKIPLKQFFKTYRKTNKVSKQKKDSLPYGTFDIYICNTELFLKICGWVKGVYSHY